MANRNQKFSTTIQLQGQADFSQIISQLQNLRKEAESKGSKTDLLGLDRELKNIQKLNTQIQQAIAKGFSTSQEFNEFDKSVKSLFKSVENFQAQAKNISLTSLKDDLDKANKELKEAKTKYEEISKLNAQIVRQELSKVKNGNTYATRILAAAADESKDINKEQAAILDKLKKEADAAQSVADAEKAAADNAKSRLEAAEKTAQINKEKYQNLRKTGTTLTDADYAMFAPSKNRQTLSNTARQQIQSAFNGRITEDILHSFANQGYNNNGTVFQGAYSQLTEQLSKIKGISFDESDTDQIKKVFLDMMTKLAQNFHMSEIANEKVDIQQEKYNEAQKNATKSGKIAHQTSAQYLATETVLNSDEVTKALEEIIKKRNEQAAATQKATDAEEEYKAQNIPQTLQDAETELSKVETDYEQVSSATLQAAESQRTLDNSFDQLKNRITLLFSFANVYQKVRQVIQQTFNDVRSIDKAFTEIAMVTSYSVQEMWGTYDQYAEIANELGQTTESVIRASGLYYQQGLETNEAISLATDTMKLATLAGLDFEQATSLMTAAIRGFHMEMNQGTHVTDVYSELAAKAAASVNDIAQAMSRTASIANSAGMSFENTSAMLTTMIEATQESAENLGTAMKTIVARFTELKNNVSAAESEFDDLDLNKVDTALKSIGVSLKNANGQFRNIDDVLLETSEKWDSLDRNSQRYIATIAAGSRQQSRFIALMENYDRTMELIEVAQDSAGKSSEQFAKYQDSVENKINRLKNSWEQLRLSFLQSDTYKTAIDGLNGIVEKISKLDAKRLAAIGIVGATLGRQVIEGFIKSLQKSTNLIQTTWDKTINKVTSQSDSIIQKAIDKIYDKLNTSYTKALNNSMAEVRNNLINMGVPAKAISNELLQWFVAMGQNFNKMELIEDELLKWENLNRELTIEEQEHIESLNKEVELYKQQNKQLAEKISKQGQLTSQAKRPLDADKIYEWSKDQKNVPAPTLKQVKLSEDAIANLKGGISLATSTAITTGITMALSGSDFKTILKTVGISTLTSVLPSILNVALPILGKFLVNSVLPILIPVLTNPMTIALAAAIAIVVAGIKKINKEYSSEEQLKRLKERAEQIKKMAENAESTHKEKQSKVIEDQQALESLEKLKEKYEELSKKQVKTVEEQEEFNSVIQEIQEKYPSIIPYYNEVTGQLIEQNKQWDLIIDKQKESIKLAAKQEYAAGIRSIELKEEANNAENVEKRTKSNYASLDFGNYYSQKASFLSLWGRDNAYWGTDSKFTAKEDIANFIEEQQEKGSLSNRQILAELEEAGFNSEIAAEANNLNLNNSEDLSKLLNLLSTDQELYEKNLKAWSINLEQNDQLFKKQQRTERKDMLTAYISESSGYQSQFVNDYLARQALSKTDSVSKLTLEQLKDGKKRNEQQEQLYRDTLSSYFNSLSEIEFKSMIENLGIKQDEDYFERVKNSGELQRGLSSQIIDSAWADSFVSELNEQIYSDALLTAADEVTISKEAEKVISDFETNIGTYSLNDLENKTNSVIKKLAKVDTGEDSLIEQAKQNIKDIQETIGENIFGENVTDEQIKTLKLDNLNFDTLSAFSNFLQNTLSSISGKPAVYYEQLRQLGEGIDPDKFIQLASSIDWAETTGANVQQKKEEFLALCKELGVSGGEKLFEGLKTLNENHDVYSELFTNGLQISAYEESINKLLNVLSDKKDAFSEAFKNPESDWIKGDKAAVDSLNEALVEMKAAGASGIEEITKYYEVVDGEVKLNAKKIRETYEDAATGHSDYLKKIQEKTQKYNNQNIESMIKGFGHKGLIQEEGYAYMGKVLNDDEKLIKKIWEESNGDINTFNQLLSEAIDNINKSESLLQTVLKDLDGIDHSYEGIVNKTSSLVSNAKQWMIDQKTNGYLSSSDVNSIITSLQEIDAQINKSIVKNVPKLDLSEIMTKTTNGIHLSSEALVKYIDELIHALEITPNLTAEQQKYLLVLRATRQEWQIAQQEVAETQSAVSKTWETYQEKLEAEAKARENLTEKIEAQAKAERELQEAYYGTENHKNKTDPLYNYQTQRTQLQDRQTRAKDNLENAKSEEDLRAYINDYFQSAHDEIVNLQAQNELMNQHINNQKEILDTKLSSELARLKAEGAVDMSLNVADFYEEIDGRWYIDYDRLNAANIPDDISDYIEGVVEDMNNYAKSIEDNLDSIKAKEKELKDFQKQARNDYLNVVNKVAEVLKQKYQQEVDDVKDKYEAIKDADNDYLHALEEAINKQRELRNRANQWDDLAKQEKKLSLKMRDTSGANAKEVQKLQEDTQKKREELLDNTVDDIVKGLKEIYEEQQETRDAEIEYRQAVLDNKNLIEEATAIVNNWDSVEDAKAFFLSMDEEYIKASGETLEKLLEDVESYYADVQTYQEARLMDIETFTQTSADEIQHLTQTMSETMTTEADRAMNEVTAKVDETIENAKDAVTNAINAVVEAQRNLTIAIGESADAWKAYAEAKATASGIDITPTYEPPTDYREDHYGKYKVGDTVYIPAISGNQDDAIDYFKTKGLHGIYNEKEIKILWDHEPSTAEILADGKPGYSVFKNGGLVDYTGPAWVDGTPTQPEAFLNYEDTRNIGQLIDVLRSLNFTNQFNSQPSTNPSIGDTHIEININIENVSSDYDVDQAVERVRQDIVDIATQAGSTVILHK